MQEKDLVIAVILAVFLHGGIALVRMSAPQPYPPPQKKTLDISIISEYERKPEVSEIAVDTANRRKNKKRYDPKKDVLKEVTGKRTDIAAKEEGKVDIPSEGERAEISEPPPPLQPEPDVGGRAEKGVTEPAIPCYKYNPSPRYPEAARRRGYEGEALLSVMISVDGMVVELKVKRSSGHRILDRAAMKAVATWEFEPARRMGNPVPVSVDIPVRFVLRGP